MSKRMEFNQEMATDYDRGIRRTLPTYDGLIRMTSSALRLYTKEQASVMLIGAGGGNELIELAEQQPLWTFTAVDPSEPMLADAKQKARRRLDDERVTFIQGSASNIPINETFDAAACLLVLHFIADDLEKVQLLKEIRSRLQLGAPFVMASMTGNPEQHSFDEQFALWRQCWLDRTSLTEEDVYEMEKSIRTLSFLPETTIEAMLKKSGFGNTTKFFQTTFFSAWMCQAE